jgi:hypothetical protein
VVGLGPDVARARVLVHGAVRAEELAEQQRALSADYAGFEVKRHRAGRELFIRGLVVKHFGEVELRVVVSLCIAGT